MKRYGKKNDAYDDGDKLSNSNNAVKTSIVGTKHSSLRSTKQKRRLRTIMNKRTRACSKQDLLKENKF